MLARLNVLLPLPPLPLQVGISLQRMADSSVRTGIKMRSALMSEIFRKTFRLSAQHTKVWTSRFGQASGCLPGVRACLRMLHVYSSCNEAGEAAGTP